jgi:hypothetical protein
MSELLRDWVGLDLAKRRAAAGRSLGDLIGVIAISAIGLSLSFIAITMLGLSLSFVAALG